jgi:sigma-B regulation protein RsbU (phosphoserine phosphatase)
MNHRLLRRGIPGRHTAIHYATFDTSTLQMRIVSAGMPGPLLLRGKDCQALQIAGIPPDLFSEATYDEFLLQLEPGDSLLFCSDGLTDARHRQGQEFELDGLRDICRGHASDSPIDLLNHIFSSIQDFSTACRQWEDMTAAVFHLSGTLDLSLHLRRRWRKGHHSSHFI